MPPRQKRKIAAKKQQVPESTSAQAPSVPAEKEQTQTEALVEPDQALLPEKKKKVVTAFSTEHECELAEWLLDHPILWNKKMVDYKDITMKDTLWKGQAEVMDKSVKELQVWYKSIRTRYGRLKKMPSGSGGLDHTERDKWILEKFEFLRPYIVDVPRRVPVSILTKKGLNQQTEGEACAEIEQINQTESLRPIQAAKRSEITPSPCSSISSARHQDKREDQEGEIVKLQQQLLDYFKKPQPAEERDCYADWLRSVFHSFDDTLFRRCQREISNVVFKFQEIMENKPRSQVRPQSVQILRPGIQQPENSYATCSGSPNRHLGHQLFATPVFQSGNHRMSSGCNSSRPNSNKPLHLPMIYPTQVHNFTARYPMVRVLTSAAPLLKCLRRQRSSQCHNNRPVLTNF